MAEGIQWHESQRVIDTLGFWTVATALVAGVAAILILALRRGAADGTGMAELQIYRDQLSEVSRDVARGTIAPADEARIRTEIGRRLLEADRAARAPVVSATDTATARIAASVVAGILIAAIGLYARWGAPAYPDLPLAARLAQSDAVMANRPDQAQAVTSAAPAPALPTPDAAFLDLMDKLRATIATRPDDVAGLALLARNEAALGNLAAAEAAQRQLIAAKGDAASADDHTGLAEVMIRAAGGYISPQAEAELVRALERDPANGAARYFSGLMFAQGGRYDRTFALWQPLIDEGPADAPWIAPIRAQMAEIAYRAGINYELPPEVGAKAGAEAGAGAGAGAGPDAADIAAAAGMSPEDRQAMIQGMVAQLSARLASEGGPAEDWAKLIRALGVLGDTDQAALIYAEAQARFSGDAAALSFLGEAALEAGLAP